MSTARYRLKYVVSATASGLGLSLRLQIPFLRSHAIDNLLVMEFERLEEKVTGTVARIFDATHSGEFDDRGYEGLYQYELTELNLVCQEISVALDRMLAQIPADDLSVIQKNIEVDRGLISIVAHAYTAMRNPKSEDEQ